MLPTSFRRRELATAALLLALPFAAQAVPDRATGTPAELLARLSSNAGGAITSTAIADDAYNTVQAANGAVLLSDNVSGKPTERALSFLSIYGGVSGITDAANQLKTVRISSDAGGKTHVHMDQFHNGLPVFGARMVVHMNGAGITGMNGVFLKGLEGLSTTPATSTSVLRANALAAARKLHPQAKTLTVQSSRLMIYNTGLLQSLPGSNRLAYEVMVTNGLSSGVRERIILDANNGFILNRINEIHSVLNRKIYTPVLNLPTGGEATPVYTEKSAGTPADPAFSGDTKGSPASSRTHGPGTQPLDNLYLYAGGTWQMYKVMFGADGYDFTSPPAGGQVQKSVYLANDQCPNAYWDGTSTNYCPGFDADDVVSHEWSHAYTEYTHGLVYQYQSGALNESYSDIFGETYDLIDGFEGPLGATLTEGQYYPDGSRWVVGEDLSDAAASILLRDMWDPDSFGTPSPGSAFTSTNYECGTGDNGGVHTNSGVPNHAYAMLVDGKTFNGVTIPKIGLEKAARIYFHAETNYQTPTTNFTQHADALDQSCQDLIGIAPNNVFGTPIAAKITQTDCDAIKQASLAVEFRRSVKVKCNYTSILSPESSTPALCTTGKAAKNFFSEGFDGGAALPTGWTQGKNLPSGGLDIPPWTTTTALPAPHTGRAAFFGNAGEGSCAAPTDASASHFLDTPAITTPVATGFLRFTHFMQSEALYDGGNLKVSVNGGAFVIVPPAAFTYNGHSGRFSAAMGPTTPTGNNTSPNAGQAAWTGSDQGEATGSWGTTIVDLSKLTTPATAGGNVKFRFDFANDGCGGNLGWFVEDVKAYQCVTNVAPTAKFKSVTPTSGAPGVVVTFDGSDSTDPDAGDSVVSFTMSFGDGSPNVTQASPTFTHTYAAAGEFNAALSVTDSVGANSTNISARQLIKVIAAAVTPFTFIERTDVKANTFITSELVKLAGFTGNLAISVADGAQYSVNGGAFTATAGMVKAGDSIAIRHVSNATEGGVKTSSVTVGSYTTALKTTTTVLDHVPDAYDFGTSSNAVAGSTVKSPTLTLVGYDDAGISPGPGVSYSINGGPFTTAAGTLVKGSTLQIQAKANTASLGYTKAYVTVGTVRGNFTIRTAK